MKKALVVLINLLATLVFADTGIGSVATNITANIEGFVFLLTSAAYIAGLGFFFGSVSKLKAYKDNPNQTPLGVPIVMIMIGASLFYLPSFINMVGYTLFTTPSTMSIFST
jgi:intracellular multiplication protein IcmD